MSRSSLHHPSSRVSSLVLGATASLVTAAGAFAQACVETPFAGTHSAPVLYFDLTADKHFTASEVHMNLLAPSTTSVSYEIWWRPAGTFIGNNFGNPTALGWVQVQAGGVAAAGPNAATEVPLTNPWHVPAGTFGVALIAIGTQHYFNIDNTSTQMGEGCNMGFAPGAADSAPWAGIVGNTVVWNGRICAGPQIGTTYCSPANANSISLRGVITAYGSALAPRNNVTLVVKGVPPHQFGVFLNSQTMGFYPNAGGSNGNLCLDGSIGRYAQCVLHTGTGLVGEACLSLDLTQTPTPSGWHSIATPERWHFQFWHRDLGNTSNFSDAVWIQF